MPTLQEVFRSVIQRLARREVRAVARPLRQDLRALRRKVAGLPKTVSALSRHVATLVRERDAERAHLQASAEEVQAARFSPASGRGRGRGRGEVMKLVFAGGRRRGAGVPRMKGQ